MMIYLEEIMAEMSKEEREQAGKIAEKEIYDEHLRRSKDKRRRFFQDSAQEAASKMQPSMSSPKKIKRGLKTTQINSDNG